MMMATAKRCSNCGVDYPSRVDYRHCPVCGNETDGILYGNPIPNEEAERLANEAAFERFYVAREAQRIADGRPLPSAEEIERRACELLGRDVERMRKGKK